MKPLQEYLIMLTNRTKMFVDESGDNISDSGSMSDDDSVIFKVTKNPSLTHSPLQTHMCVS